MSDELDYFLEITRVPRPSFHMERINEYLISFAVKHGLEYVKDDNGNIVIRRPGKGVTITLQAHQDMVPTAVPGKDFDFTTMPIETVIEDGWIHAVGTTLGADDGAGMAIMLAALAAPELEGVSLECLFTTDEEVGLIGALKMEKGFVGGRYLINLDNEDIGEITIGCAGSTDIVATFPVKTLADDGDVYVLDVGGLLGGHSAGKIDAGRGNALLIATGFVRSFEGVRISSFTGGSVPNVIPMNARVVFTVPRGTDVSGAFGKYRDSVTAALKDTDSGVTLTLSQAGKVSSWSADTTSDILGVMLSCPSGVIEKDSFGVKTSNNVAIARTSDDSFELTVKPRSSDTSYLYVLVDEIRKLFASVGGFSPEPSIFPAWREEDDSPFVAKAAEVYESYFGKLPLVTVIHGGLESSVVKDKCPGMEAIAFGPTIFGEHSPDEKMDIATLAQAKGYVFELIRELHKGC